MMLQERLATMLMVGVCLLFLVLMLSGWDCTRAHSIVTIGPTLDEAGHIVDCRMTICENGNCRETISDEPQCQE